MEIEEIRKSNMVYLNLNCTQILEHESLMKRPIGSWPKILNDHIKKERKNIGFCGDALSCWLADYIRGRDELIEELK